MPNPEAPNAVPSFDSIAALDEALQAKDDYAPIDLYPRDGTELLCEVESRVANLVGVQADELVLCSSGMSAVVGAIEACVKPGDVIACGQQMYSQTRRFMDELPDERGVTVVSFDSGAPGHVERVIQRHQPDIIVAETVGNGPDVPVLDVGLLLEHPVVQNNNPYIILDNTLPLSTAEPLAKVLNPEKNIIGVESGTKSYAFNRDVFGHIYTKNPNILRQIRERRRTRGFGPNVADIEHIHSLLPADRETFDTYNKAVFQTTGQLALACYEAADGSDVFVTHPVLDNHQNQGMTSPEFPDGTTPVFFLQLFGEKDQYEVTTKLWNHPVIREHCELGQSFAFRKTRILFDKHTRNVRISGGADSDSAKLGVAFQEALS